VYRGGLGSYGLASLIASFLQLHPKIQSGEIKSDENLGVLLIEFLELYGKKFNYEDCAISITDDGSYFLKESKGWYDKDRPFSLCVQDVEDPGNDVTKGSFNFRIVKHSFSRAYDILVACIYEQYARMKGDTNDDRHHRSDHLRSPENGKSTQFLVKSILSCILELHPSVLVHRRHVWKLYHEQILGERDVDESLFDEIEMLQARRMRWDESLEAMAHKASKSAGPSPSPKQVAGSKRAHELLDEGTDHALSGSSDLESGMESGEQPQLCTSSKSTKKSRKASKKANKRKKK
jgi:DNA polymerase sigma